jgi:hypothetical protein
MGLNYKCDFNLQDCMHTIGVEERGRVQQVVTDEVLRLSDNYVPFQEGSLKASGHIENQTDVVLNTPYARYMWNGIVYEDPDLHCAGFKTENGWRSRKGVKKVPSDPVRKLQYNGEKTRGGHWVERMLQDGGRDAIEKAARLEAGK